MKKVKRKFRLLLLIIIVLTGMGIYIKLSNGENSAIKLLQKRLSQILAIDKIESDDSANNENKTEEKNEGKTENKANVAIGTEIDDFKGVAVFNNGEEYAESYGKNFSKDGYYYGYKWQCVEYVKRFYYEVKKHKMPNVYGHAKDFFDKGVSQGAMNKSRGLIQYINGKNVKPKVDDILVFNDTTYGHVAIVTEVGEDYIEVIQQNVYGKTRERHKMKVEKGNYIVGTSRKPAGWLRKQ